MTRLTPVTRPRSDVVPAPVLVLGGIVSVQVGAAIAKDLFAAVPPTTLTWLRLVTSAVIFTVAFRPRLRGRTRTDWLVALGYGACLLIMNWAIYQSFARIPLGMAVTIEFLGPLAVAVIGSRRPVDLIWACLAAAGIVLLGFSPYGLTWAGIGFALLAAAGWACYILAGAQTARRWPGMSGLVVASWLGAVVLAPPALIIDVHVLTEPRVLITGAAIGLLSSVVPYSLELIALRRIPARVFGILMSLEPAVAALAAMIIIGELMGWRQWTALGCVVAASIGASWRRRGMPGDASAR